LIADADADTFFLRLFWSGKNSIREVFYWEITGIPIGAFDPALKVFFFDITNAAKYFKLLGT